MAVGPGKGSTMNARLAAAVATGAGCLVGQPTVTTLEIEIDNTVCYLDDVADPAKKATSAVPVPIPQNITYRTFKLHLCMGDIVAVNGTPAKGFYLRPWTQVLSATALTPGRNIADVAGSCMGTHTFNILHEDGTPIGSIMASGVAGRPIPPGAPQRATGSNLAVVGGTGAFFGVRGQVTDGPELRPGRNASMLEDPAYRRIHGGGKRVMFVQLLPMTAPEVLNASETPAIFHADFSPVNAANPARAGERLIVSVSGLGPVKPNLRAGEPFPAYEEGKTHEVNSPVEVNVNGNAAAVVNKIGWSTLTNVYRFDFVVPDGTAPGMATLAFSVAWINGPVDQWTRGEVPGAVTAGSAGSGRLTAVVRPRMRCDLLVRDDADPLDAGPHARAAKRNGGETNA